MSYEKQNFTNGTVLTADHLNHMEEGIGTVADAVAELEAVSSELVESVNNHESRIATLEEGGGSGGKLYLHRVFMNYCVDVTDITLLLTKYTRSADSITESNITIEDIYGMRGYGTQEFDGEELVFIEVENFAANENEEMVFTVRYICADSPAGKFVIAFPIGDCDIWDEVTEVV